MAQVLEAIYEGGAFRPVDAVSLPDGQRVTISVEPHAMTRAEAEAYVARWHTVFEGLSDAEMDELGAAITERSQLSRDLDLED